MASRCRFCGEERTQGTKCRNGHWIGAPVDFSRKQEYTLQYLSRGMTREKFTKEGRNYWPGTSFDDLDFVEDWIRRWGRNPVALELNEPTSGNPLFD